MDMFTGFLSVMDSTGDTTIKWHRDNPNEVEAARLSFEHLLSKNFTAYRVKNGERGERITKFDPNAGEIVMVPRIVGG